METKDSRQMKVNEDKIGDFYVVVSAAVCQGPAG
jgi:hypothetical protein